CGAAGRGPAADEGAWLLAAPRLQADRSRPEDGAPNVDAGRTRSPRAAAPAGRGAAAVRLPAARDPAGARGDEDEPQAALSPLPGRGPERAPSARPQAGHRHAGADGNPAGAEPALVAGLRR